MEDKTMSKLRVQQTNKAKDYKTKQPNLSWVSINDTSPKHHKDAKKTILSHNKLVEVSWFLKILAFLSSQILWKTAFIVQIP